MGDERPPKRTRQAKEGDTDGGRQFEMRPDAGCYLQPQMGGLYRDEGDRGKSLQGKQLRQKRRSPHQWEVVTQMCYPLT